MKKTHLFLIIICLLLGGVLTAHGQRRRGQTKPPAKTTSPIQSPTPTQKATSPAQGFFNEGLNCPTEDYDCQISNYTKAINLGLATKEVFKNRGNAYLQRKDIDKALADYTKLIELDPNDTSGYKNRGKLYHEISNSPQAVNAAIRDFTSAIDLEPKDIEAYILRAKAYFTTNQIEKGHSDLDTVVRIDPRNTNILLFQAKIFANTEEFEKALEKLSSIISIQPENTEAFIEQAKIYERQRKYDLAVNDYRKVIGLDPENAMSHVGLAEVFEKIKKFDDALKEYTKAIELTPTNTDFLFKRARLYRNQRKRAEASADITKVIELSPGNARAYEFRCGIEKEDANDLKAVEDCSIAITLDPNVDDAYLYRFEILDAEQSNLTAATLKYFSEIVKNAPPLQPVYDIWLKDLKLGSKNKRLKAGYAIRTGSPNSKNFEELASGEILRGYFWLAEENFNQALNLDPKSSDAYVGRGRTLYFKSENTLLGGGGDFNTSSLLALQDFLKAAKLDPYNKNLLKELYYVSISKRNDVLKLRLDLLNILIGSNPDNISLLANRVRTLLDIFDNEIKNKEFHKRDNYELKLINENWNGIPRLIDADSQKIVEIYRSSKKGSGEDSAMKSAYIGLTFPYPYRNLKQKYIIYSKRLEILEKLIARVPEYYWFYSEKVGLLDSINKQSTPARTAAHQKGQDLLKDWHAKSYADLMNLNSAIQKGVEIAKNISIRSPEVAIQPNFNKSIWEQELQKVEREDAYADKLLAAYQTRTEQEIQRLRQEAAEIQRREKEEKARRNAETMNALIGLITTTAEVISTNRRGSSTMQTPPPNSRPQNTQTAGQPTTANTTGGGSSNVGNKYLKTGEIIISDTIMESQKERPDDFASKNTDCLIAGYTQYTHSWSGWQPTSIDGLLWRNMGPRRACGNPINNEKGKVAYDWYFAYKNTTNSIIYVECDQISGDGTPVNTCGGLIGPGGVIKHSDAANHTFSDAPNVSFKLRYLETCTAVRMSKDGLSGWGCQ